MGSGHNFIKKLPKSKYKKFKISSHEYVPILF